MLFSFTKACGLPMIELKQGGGGGGAKGKEIPEMN